jgi:two-component system cell cycle response regulator DivK
MSKRILVVEDQEDNRQIVRDLLSSRDYEITEAENGEEAIASVAKYRPDLILMYIQLPVMDGYEATRRIKADPSLSSTPKAQRYRQALRILSAAPNPQTKCIRPLRL